MNSVCSLTAVEDVLLESIVDNEDFYEFSNILFELTSLTNELFMETVKDTTPSLSNFGSNVKKNTIDTTRDVIGAYGNIVDANSNLIKATWDVVMRAVDLFSRAIGSIINKITNIPIYVLKVADKVMDIPSNIKNKIKGNISLYISAADIEMIYNKLFIKRLTEYITLASDLAKGEFWSTFTNRRIGNSEKGHLIFGKNDMKTCRKMDAVFDHIKNTEFKPVGIEMKDPAVIDIYFGNAKSIKYTDLYGKYHETTYYEALTGIIKALEDKKEDLVKVQKDIGDKLHRTEANQNYNDLNNPAKYRLNTTITQISKVVSIIGNLTKYIIADINTINKSVDKMLGKVADTKTKKDKPDKVATKL